MSEAALGLSKQVRRLCQGCCDRKARFSYRGRVKADRNHTLCFECFRSARDQRRAEVLAAVPRPRPLASPFDPPRRLTAREIAHRRRMLAALQHG